MLNVELANSKSIVAVHPFQESMGGFLRPSFYERTSTSTVQYKVVTALCLCSVPYARTRDGLLFAPRAVHHGNVQ